jgi:transcription termination factor Rho
LYFHTQGQSARISTPPKSLSEPYIVAMLDVGVLHNQYHNVAAVVVINDRPKCLVEVSKDVTDVMPPVRL